MAAAFPFIAAATPAQAHTVSTAKSIPNPTNVKLFNPDYDRVPLRKDNVSYMIIQSRDDAIDYKNPSQGHRESLDHMLSLLDRTFSSFTGAPDLISFHEMPLHGFGEWTRKEMLRVAIEVPGRETDALCIKAKELNSYISFGAYVKDKDWPDHVIMMGILIDPNGEVVAKHWKARGTLGGIGLYTSTVYENLDRYVEMYGIDEVIPVARTDIGNICLTGIQFDPMLFMAMSMKGAEIFCRYATGSVPKEEAMTMSRCFRVYTGYANSSRHVDHRHYVGGVGTGGSVIVDPSGKIMAEGGEGEGAVRATLPMAKFRSTHRIPSPHMALYEPILEQFHPRFSPNWFTKYLPSSWADTRQYFKDKSNW